MKIQKYTDKTIRITFLLLILILFIFILLLLQSFLNGSQLGDNNSIFVKQCGLSKYTNFKMSDGTLIKSHISIVPYNMVEIKATDYFSLKNGRQPIMYEHKTHIEDYHQYYTDAIFAGNQSEYYTSILKGFRNVKSNYNLDDDQYLQLIVTFVQMLPYYSGQSDVKYPLVTYVEGCGDCDDKSLLLLALLSQENYNVSLVIIPSENKNLPSHAMAGIASNHAASTKGGYAMIETTKKNSVIGEFPSNVQSKNVSVIKIGNGIKNYETYTTMVIWNRSAMYKVTRKGNVTISITPYHQDFEIFDFFRDKKVNYDWKNDCKNNISIPSLICHQSGL